MAARAEGLAIVEGVGSAFGIGDDVVGLEVVVTLSASSADALGFGEDLLTVGQLYREWFLCFWLNCFLNRCWAICFHIQTLWRDLLRNRCGLFRRVSSA